MGFEIPKNVNIPWRDEHKYLMWSGGKDSTATIILCHEMGIPVDEIVYAEVYYDHSRDIVADNFEHHEWMHKVAIPMVEVGMTEKDARQICEDYGLLSPTYKNSNRGGVLVLPCIQDEGVFGVQEGASRPMAGTT